MPLCLAGAVLPSREKHEGSRGRRHHPAGDFGQTRTLRNIGYPRLPSGGFRHLSPAGTARLTVRWAGMFCPRSPFTHPPSSSVTVPSLFIAVSRTGSRRVPRMADRTVLRFESCRAPARARCVRGVCLRRAARNADRAGAASERGARAALRAARGEETPLLLGRPNDHHGGCRRGSASRRAIMSSWRREREQSSGGGASAGAVTAELTRSAEQGDGRVPRYGSTRRGDGARGGPEGARGGEGGRRRGSRAR